MLNVQDGGNDSGSKASRTKACICQGGRIESIKQQATEHH